MTNEKSEPNTHRGFDIDFKRIGKKYICFRKIAEFFLTIDQYEKKMYNTLFHSASFTTRDVYLYPGERVKGA